MDQYLSTVIIALITGVFSVITLIIQKKQDHIVSKIDEQTSFIEKEKTLKQKLAKKEKEKELLIHEIMILILNTNLEILEHTNGIVADDIKAKSEELQKGFTALTAEIDALNKEYQMVLDLTSEFQKKINTKL
jgi:hypothetical protein